VSERRFTDDEVALILQRAADASTTADVGLDADTALNASNTPGMSLAELQTIAREAGIDPQAVADAAGSVARGDLVPTAVRHATGAPIALARIIAFEQEVDDRTWARMVVQLQETFGARGRLRTDGALREWSNGNLRAVLEPTPHGHQLRLSTRKGNAEALRLVGNLGIGFSVVLAAFTVAVSAAKGQPLPDAPVWVTALVPGLMGLGARLQDILSRRSWGRERADQMQALASQLRAVLPGDR
jgi:hypothetical protein